MKDFRKEGMHILHLHINILISKIDEVRCVPIIGIGQSKLDLSILNTKADIEVYDVIRLNCSGRGGRVTWYIRKSLSYNHKLGCCPNTENIFIDTFLTKLKTTLVGL